MPATGRCCPSQERGEVVFTEFEKEDFAGTRKAPTRGLEHLSLKEKRGCALDCPNE